MGVLVYPSLYYYTYVASPPRVRSMMMAFNIFCQGSLSRAFIVLAGKRFSPDDLDTGRLEDYYLMNILWSLVGLTIYFWLTCCASGQEDRCKASNTGIDKLPELAPQGNPECSAP